MSLHDRIMELDHGYEGANFSFKDGYGEGKKDAAKLATEADTLMAEMAEALAFYADTDYLPAMAQIALDQYNTYMERNNEQ